jgi:hypothetical protein
VVVPYVHGAPFMSPSHIASFIGSVAGQTLQLQVPSGPMGGPPHSQTLVPKLQASGLSMALHMAPSIGAVPGQPIPIPPVPEVPEPPVPDVPEPPVPEVPEPPVPDVPDPAVPLVPLPEEPPVALPPVALPPVPVPPVAVPLTPLPAAPLTLPAEPPELTPPVASVNASSSPLHAEKSGALVSKPIKLI